MPMGFELALGVLVMAAFIRLVVKLNGAEEKVRSLARRVDQLQNDLERLSRSRQEPVSPAPPPVVPAVPRPSARVELWRESLGPLPAPLPPRPPPPPIQVARPWLARVDWEQFMGVKLFAWVGGLALFLGVVFFVKYAFDRNLVPPELRVAVGFVVGLGLLAGGILVSRREYRVLSQTFCATGVVILDGVAFACHAVYHFQPFGLTATFLLMSLITAAAFGLAARLDARVVAILGLFAGFLTPIVLSTGRDQPLALFGYIGMLDIGLLALALNRRWFFLSALGALGTGLMQLGWATRYLESGGYFYGNKIFVPFAVLAGFNALFLTAAGWQRKRAPDDRWVPGSMLGLAALAGAFASWFLTQPSLAQRPALVFGFVVVIDLLVAALVWWDGSVVTAQVVAGGAVFLLLTQWTIFSATTARLPVILVFYLIFAVLHAVYPLALRRRWPAHAAAWPAQLFPALALLLVLVQICDLPAVSWLVWPFIAVIDFAAFILAAAVGSVTAVIAMLVLTLAGAGLLILKIPAGAESAPLALYLTAGFAVMFTAGAVWLGRKLPSGQSSRQLPAFSALLPFVLLIQLTALVPSRDPSPVLGVGLLLVLLLLGSALVFSAELLPALALVGVAALEYFWHFLRFNNAEAGVALAWYLVFLGILALYPFVFWKRWANATAPFATAAAAGVAQFYLVYRLIGSAFPNRYMGAVPALFALPPLAGLAAIRRWEAPSSPARQPRLAWFGGASLLFITLIFPIQFQHQWLTLGWALEGAAVLWLYVRVPQDQLRLTGVALLAAVFFRLALNPYLFDFMPRGPAPFLNWYLYTYGIVCCCLFAGARSLAPPRNLVLGCNAPPVLAGAGLVLAFILLNLEIDDFFTPVGRRLTFDFTADFARDMTYSIAWALFALALLVWGLARKIAPLRYAALLLLTVTVAKLFLHDLASLGQLYRIGAFIGVAIVAIASSFAYQKFFAASAADAPTE